MFCKSRPTVACVSVAAVLAAGGWSLTFAQDAEKAKPPAEPTAEQLEAAKKAFAARGAEYRLRTGPETKSTVHEFRLPRKTTDADLKGLPNPDFSFGLELFETHVTDAGLQHLRELKGLTSLDLGATQVTDAGLQHLRDLKGLTSLYLSGTKVTDAGLPHLRELKGLTSLYLRDTTVTDAGLQHLRELKGLTWLNLSATQVTDAGKAELRKALPKCKID